MVGALVAGMAGGMSINIVIRAIDKFSGVFSKVNKGMLIAGGAITTMGVGGVVAMGKLVGTASDFETAFTGVKKTVELTDKEFDELKQRFVDLSKVIPVSFVELSRIGEIAGQLGVEGVDNLAKFTRTIADIASTTNLTSEEAATSFARIANVMGVPISEVDRMGSAIVDLGNNFATSEQEIVNMTMRIMGAGKTIGLNTQEVFGMSAALSALGIRSEMGGSAISRAMITISKSVAEGGDTLAKYAEVSGMTIDEFSIAWKTKPVEAMSAVIMGLKDITESGGNTFGILEDLDLKSIRITDTMLRLAGSQGGITDAVNMSKKAWEENTARVIEANKRYATAESQVIMLDNKFLSLRNDMGELLLPTFKKLVDLLGKAIDWFQEHPQLTKFAVAALAIGTAVALIVGPALIIAAVLPFVAAGLTAVSIAGLPVWVVFLIIAAIILAIIGIVILVIDIFDKLKNNWEEFVVGASKLFMRFNIFMTNFLYGIRIVWTKVWGSIKNFVLGIWNGIVTGIENSINRIIGFINILIGAFNRISGFFGIGKIGELGNISLAGAKAELMDIQGIVKGLERERGLEVYDLQKAQAKLTADAAVVIAARDKEKVNVEVNIENVYGTDPDQIAEALAEQVNKTIRI